MFADSEPSYGFSEIWLRFQGTLTISATMSSYTASPDIEKCVLLGHTTHDNTGEQSTLGPLVQENSYKNISYNFKHDQFTHPTLTPCVPVARGALI